MQKAKGDARTASENLSERFRRLSKKMTDDAEVSVRLQKCPFTRIFCAFCRKGDIPAFVVRHLKRSPLEKDMPDVKYVRGR